MNTMTLEQVRDALRGALSPDYDQLFAWADAIADHLRQHEAAKADYSHIAADLLACDWQEGDLFYVNDDPDEHKPCYLVMPDGACLVLNHHATNGVDQARAQFIADCCNQALCPIQAPIEAVTPMLASAPDKRLEQEQDDIDKILAKLGLPVERTRTECGYLRVNDILNHIQETLDALTEANNARIAVTDKYVKIASARVPDVDAIYEVVRGFGYTTRGQSDEIAEAVHNLLATATKPESIDHG